MAQLQRIIAHEAFAEDLLVAGARLVRLGEIVGEIRPDQLLARAQPVATSVAALTSVILPSGLMVTSGSRLASSRLRL